MLSRCNTTGTPSAGTSSEMADNNVWPIVDPERARRAPPPRQPPTVWTVFHVADRVEEAFDVLRRLPVTGRPQAFGNSMPGYAYDMGDLNAQLETGELERFLKGQNRVRLPASAADISRMHQAFDWPGRYLGRYPEVSRAVLCAAMWRAGRHNLAKRCRVFNMIPRLFFRQEWHGAQIIAMGLIRDRATVT